MNKNFKFLSLFFLLLFQSKAIFPQDSLLTRLSLQNLKTFSYEASDFSGEGWEYIIAKVEKSTNVLIGEDHLTNEIPAFIGALAATTKFDNFYIEVDPFSTEIIEQSFKNLSFEERQIFNQKYGDLFSFYSLKPEYELLEQLIDSGSKLLGSDQILMYADRLIFQDVVSWTENTKAKEIYQSIIEQSEMHLEKFYENPQNPMYFMTPGFSNHLSALEKLELSEKEEIIIRNIKKSLEIYKKQSHKKRVQLLLHQLMKDYTKWNTSKNLFKYGANHLARGESFLTVFDIGNLVGNVTTGNYQESLHIMIVGKSGNKGAPFEIFPPSPVNIKTGTLSSLTPFFDLIKNKEWHLINMIPLRNSLEKGDLVIDDITIQRAIKGYDILIIIPEVTPATF